MMSDQVEKLVKTTEPSLLPAEVVPIPIFSERDLVGEANFVDSKSSSTEGPDSSPRSNTSRSVRSWNFLLADTKLA